MFRNPCCPVSAAKKLFLPGQKCSLVDPPQRSQQPSLLHHRRRTTPRLPTIHPVGHVHSTGPQADLMTVASVQRCSPAGKWLTAPRIGDSGRSRQKLRQHPRWCRGGSAILTNAAGHMVSDGRVYRLAAAVPGQHSGAAARGAAGADRTVAPSHQRPDAWCGRRMEVNTWLSQMWPVTATGRPGH